MVAEVRSRLGDLLIAEKRFEEAVEVLGGNVGQDADPTETAYAMLRRGDAAAAAGKTDQAVEYYDRLIERFPDQPRAEVARLAAAKIQYRDGKLADASERLALLARSSDPDVAAESAHWLSRLRLRVGAADDAARIASETLDRVGSAATDSDYLDDLRYDLARAVAADPMRLVESIDLYVAVADQHPGSPLAPRAIYNAAYSSLKAGDPRRAITLADRYLEAERSATPMSAVSESAVSESAVSESAASLDVELRLVRAEARLADDDPSAAAEDLGRLIETRPDDARVGDWVRRAATALVRAEQTDEAIDLLTRHEEAAGAAGLFLRGQLHLKNERPGPAAEALVRAASMPTPPDDPAGLRLRRESRLWLAVAEQRRGDLDSAKETFERVIAEGESVDEKSVDGDLLETARYKLAALLAGEDDERAAALFDRVITGGHQPALVPSAMLGRADALARVDRTEDAIALLSRLIAEYPDHELIPRARYDRGLLRVAAGQAEEAAADLKEFLASEPAGPMLGDALYELALMQQAAGRFEESATLLSRLRSEVPDFDAMDDVVYRLAWSQMKAGQTETARQLFESLIAAGDAQSNPYRLQSLAMIGQSYFDEGQFLKALDVFQRARQIVASEPAGSSRLDRDAQRIRELVLLRGGQSAAQLDRHQEAIEWLDELRLKFPANGSLAELFFELGSSHRQIDDNEAALKYFGEVTEHYRNELAARARFMRGEIYFDQDKFDVAIDEFQRLMFGFGGDRAPSSIKTWQARAGFEAGRCAELLASTAGGDEGRRKALKIAARFYDYVRQKHPDHELASQAARRSEAIE